MSFLESEHNKRKEIVQLGSVRQDLIRKISLNSNYRREIPFLFGLIFPECIFRFFVSRIFEITSFGWQEGGVLGVVFSHLFPDLFLDCVIFGNFSDSLSQFGTTVPVEN